MSLKDDISCNYDIPIVASITLCRELEQIFTKKVGPVFIEVVRGVHVFGFGEPNTFFNKILTEIDVPDKYKDELKKDNIKAIGVNNIIKGNEICYILLNDDLVVREKGVQINIYRKADKV